MTQQLNQRELVLDLHSGSYQIHRVEMFPEGQRPIIGPVDYGWMKFRQGLKIVTERGRKLYTYQASQPPDVMTWGGGPLAGSRIPGTRRLVFCGYSPLWEGFYISSMGGAAYIMHRIGVDFVSIHGRAPQDSVLILNHKHGEILVRLEPIQPDIVWSGYADPDGQQLFGFYALQQAVFDRYASEYDNDWLRVFAVGPASRTTNQGIIGSNHVRKGRISAIDDWAGRGGLGSRLLQHHRIAACIFGGDWEDPDLKDSKEIDSYFQKYFNDSMIRVDLGAAEKYRYVPGFMTGGTFGVNMHIVDDNLYSFNYQSIYASDAERLQQHDNFILDHYLKQFNEEVIQPKNFAHCGEPCSVVCKKYDRIYKKDYEPYQALGPLCGVFDQRAAEQLNHFVDALGIDAIQIGSTVSWLMELISKGLLHPEEFGLPPASEMSFDFSSSPDNFDIVADSARNADYATRVIEMIVLAPAGEPFRLGIRHAAQVIDTLFPDRSLPLSSSAVYISHGSQGGLTPNQYWVPGMLAPMPMMGKYFVYYGLDYQSPRELGRKCVERMVYELFSENTGVCRFHRKWVEAIVDEILQAHYKFEINYKAHQFELSQQIYDLDGSSVRFWDSERTVDIIWQYIEKWERFGLEDDSLHEWVQRFRHDKWTAARAYWQEIRSGIAEAFAEGSLSIPDSVAPYQAASLDVMVKK